MAFETFMGEQPAAQPQAAQQPAGTPPLTFEGPPPQPVQHTAPQQPQPPVMPQPPMAMPAQQPYAPAPVQPYAPVAPQPYTPPPVQPYNPAAAPAQQYAPAPMPQQPYAPVAPQFANQPTQVAPAPAQPRPVGLDALGAPDLPPVGAAPKTAPADAQAVLEMLASAMQGKAPAPDTGSAPFAIKSPEVDPALMEKNAGVAPFVEAVAANMMNQQLAPMFQQLQEQATSAQAEANKAQQALQKANRDFYATSVYQNVPDFDQLTAHPAFDQYRSQVEPLSGMPIADMLTRANRTNDAVTVARIMGGFRNTIQSGQPSYQQPTYGSGGFTNNVQTYVAPHTAPSDPSLYPQYAGGAQAQQLDPSVFSRATAAWTSGQITRDEYERIAAPFHEAQRAQDAQALANAHGFM